MNSRKFSVQMMVEAGIMVALSYVLSLIPIMRMPYDGTVSLTTLPLIVYAIRWGFGPGLVTGALYGVLRLLIGAYIMHPVQVLLDYPLPAACMGFAGILFLKDKDKYTSYIPSILIAYLFKFVCHFLSGYVFFREYTPEGMNPIWYSTIYNISYMGPEILIVLVVIGLLWRPMKSYLRKQN